MNRRDLLALLGGAAALPPPRAIAQQRARTPRLAIFSPSEPVAVMTADGPNRYYRALFEELRKLGHVEGQNLSVERYGREQDTAGPAALVAEVVRSNPNVVYVVGPARSCSRGRRRHFRSWR